MKSNQKKWKRRLAAMATVLKTVGATHREFESHRFRKSYNVLRDLSTSLKKADVSC